MSYPATKSTKYKTLWNELKSESALIVARFTQRDGICRILTDREKMMHLMLVQMNALWLFIKRMGRGKKSLTTILSTNYLHGVKQYIKQK